jgi:hypothetical protein
MIPGTEIEKPTVATRRSATGVERERAVAAIGAMYDYRREVGLNEKVLVKMPSDGVEP